MIKKPIIAEKLPLFDANEEIMMQFTASNDVQITRNNLIVEDSLTGAEVYNETIDSFVDTHKIPKDTLSNGSSYQVRVRVGNLSVWSEFSDIRYFKCFSKPNITITNIDYGEGNKVYNQNVEFTAEYSQSESDEISSYQFVLYDQHKVLIKAYDWKIADGVISQRVEDLENNKAYHIMVNVETINGGVYSSEVVEFTPIYLTPTLSAIVDGENSPTEGAIRVNAELIQIIGTLYDNNDLIIPLDEIEYKDDEYLDMSRDDYYRVVFDKGFRITDKSFTLKLWVSNIPTLKDFFFLRDSHGEIRLTMYNDRLHAFKQNSNNSKLAHFVSDEFIYNQESQYIIILRQKLDRLDLYIEEIREVI